MINYQLNCYNGHTFTTWFQNDQSYQKLQNLDLVACPDCGICEVSIATPTKNFNATTSNPQPNHNFNGLIDDVVHIIESNYEDVADQHVDNMHNAQLQEYPSDAKTAIEGAQELIDDSLIEPGAASYDG